jgi:glucokinase
MRRPPVCKKYDAVIQSIKLHTGDGRCDTFRRDIGGTHTRVGLFSDKFKLIEKITMQTGLEGGSETVFSAVSEAVGKLREKNSVDSGQVAGLGAGVPGPVGEDGVVNRCNNLGWGITDTAGALGRLTGLR